MYFVFVLYLIWMENFIWAEETHHLEEDKKVLILHKIADLQPELIKK